ncbi:MAG: arsenate reductase [Bacteroidia bacterium]|nr:arsenate reductase [Bacteroidia bacterium]
MKKIFYLSTCDTCKRIIDELDLKKKGFEFQDIKTEKITVAQLDEMKKKTGSYEALFSKIARKYKELKLNEKKLTEAEMKKLIFEEYTFLKRPVIFIGDKLFVGNSKNVIAEAKAALQQKSPQ